MLALAICVSFVGLSIVVCELLGYTIRVCRRDAPQPPVPTNKADAEVIDLSQRRIRKQAVNHRLWN